MVLRVKKYLCTFWIVLVEQRAEKKKSLINERRNKVIKLLQEQSNSNN